MSSMASNPTTKFNPENLHKSSDPLHDMLVFDPNIDKSCRNQLKTCAMIRGWRYHGKDYLHSQMNGMKAFNQRIFRHRDDKTIPRFLPGRRLAFSTKVKNESTDWLITRLGPEFECLRYTLDWDYMKKNLIFRKILIDIGISRRADDPDYWIKVVLPALVGSIITDWRFKNEHTKIMQFLRELDPEIEMQFFHVWCPEGPSPPPDETSENDLNDHMTQFVCVHTSDAELSSGDLLRMLIEKFPQYAEYELITDVESHEQIEKDLCVPSMYESVSDSDE